MSILHIRSKYTNDPLIGVGFSLGGNVLAKYVAEISADPLKTHDLLGAITVSQGYDGVKVFNSLKYSKKSKGIHHLKKSRFYDYNISRKLLNLLKKHKHIFEGVIDVHDITQV
jgi:abhydrolase domain-containing protein 2